MKLSDVMSAADLAVYAEIGLLIFLTAFMGVVVRLVFQKSESLDEAAAIPLDDDTPVHERTVAARLENGR